MDRDVLEENFLKIRERIREAEISSGRSPGSVKLIAVSKTQPPEAIEAAYRLGHRDFGENYVQELVAKAERLQHLPDLRLHLIGHLQTNKARSVVGIAASVQSLASERLVRELGRRTIERAPERGKLPVLLEVNVGREAQKSGVLPEEVARLAELVRGEEHLLLQGLMTIPPATANLEEAYRYFVELREIRDLLGGAELLPELSMGMSQDFAVAIRAGATMVRVGTALFGDRTNSR